MSTIERRTTRAVVALEAEASCREAAQFMREHGIGSVAVVEDGALVGLVAERDLALRVVGEGWPAQTRLGEIVPREGPETTLEATEVECLELMRRHRVRHLLVRERPGGEVAGIISMRDVILLMLEEKDFAIQQLEQYITGAQA